MDSTPFDYHALKNRFLKVNFFLAYLYLHPFIPRCQSLFLDRIVFMQHLMQKYTWGSDIFRYSPTLHFVSFCKFFLLDWLLFKSCAAVFSCEVLLNTSTLHPPVPDIFTKYLNTGLFLITLFSNVAYYNIFPVFAIYW